MSAKKTVGQRLGHPLKTVTHQNVQRTEISAYGSWLLGAASENQRQKRIRIQVIMSVLIAVMNLTGIAVVVLLVTVAIPTPPVISDKTSWVTLGVGPPCLLIGLGLGAFWLTRRTVFALRWAIEGSDPSPADVRNTFLGPSRVAFAHLVLWGFWAALFTTLYGLANREFYPRFLFAVGICGIMAATGGFLITEFALRPAAAKALAAGPPPRRVASGMMFRTMLVWLLGSGLPVIFIALLGIMDLIKKNWTREQLAVGVIVVAIATFIFGSILMWIVSWFTATPVRAVRAALERVEHGDLRGDLVVFDGTELGELQRGFNSMVDGLRERERVRDLFGRHVGREVAVAAERQRPELGGEERHVAVLFVDIVGSTQLVTREPPAQVVQLLNRFFTIVVDEVDRGRGLVNKFEGDASLAVFGAPNRLDCPEDGALAAARAIADRMANEIPECKAAIGVGAGQVVAGNVGAAERFEYTVIGGPVNEAARLCELAKSHPGRVLASSEAVDGSGETERAHWFLGDAVILRGRDRPTRWCCPVERADFR